MEVYLYGLVFSLVTSIIFTAITFYTKADDEYRKVAIACVFVSFIPVLQFASGVICATAVLLFVLFHVVEWVDDKLYDVIYTRSIAERRKTWEERVSK